MVWKQALSVIVAVLTLAGGIKTYHLAIGYFETQAHASEAREEITDHVAALEKSFLESQNREAIRQTRAEMREIIDRQGTTDPLQMDGPDRVRFRELQDDLEYLQDQKEKLKGGT